MSKKIVKKCKDCDNEFQSYISKGRIFCSKACATGFRLRGKEKKEETKRKMSEFALIRFSDKTKHPRWKGDGVGYRTLHKWVENEIGRPKICSKCEKKGMVIVCIGQILAVNI